MQQKFISGQRLGGGRSASSAEKNRLKNTTKKTMTTKEAIIIRGERNTDKRTRKFVSITDMTMWEYIDKIMAHPDYEKSFNKVINSALLFGLPILYKRLFDTVEIDGEEQPVGVPKEYTEDAFYFQLIRLMKEMLANEVITKSVVCSLFNERAAALQDGKSDAGSFAKGFYQDTPNYLVSEEIRMLKDVGR